MIVSTVAQRHGEQRDGRFWVTETHTLDDASVRTFETLCDPDTDYEAMAAARATAINAELAAEAARVPETVTSAQARRAIDAAGLRANVEAAVAGASAIVQKLWYEAESIDRDNQTVIALGAAVGLDSAALDNLFRTAARL